MFRWLFGRRRVARAPVSDPEPVILPFPAHRIAPPPSAEEPVTRPRLYRPIACDWADEPLAGDVTVRVAVGGVIEGDGAGI